MSKNRTVRTTVTRLCSTAGLLVLVTSLIGAAKPVTPKEPTTCETGATPSCAPKQHWACIHGTIDIPNKCDPDTLWCVDDAE